MDFHRLSSSKEQREIVKGAESQGGLDRRSIPWRCPQTNTRESVNPVQVGNELTGVERHLLLNYYLYCVLYYFFRGARGRALTPWGEGSPRGASSGLIYYRE